MEADIVSRLKEDRRFEPSNEFREHARIDSAAAYHALYSESIEEPERFWREQTQDIVWRTPWKTFSEWTPPSTGRVLAKFFVGGTLNITETCLDRHLSKPTRTRAA